MRLRPKYILQTNEYWAWDNDGAPLLVKVNLATGQEAVVIFGGPPADDMFFFEVEINVASYSVTVHVNCDLNSFHGEQYKINGLFVVKNNLLLNCQRK